MMTSHQEGTADKKKKEKVVLTGLSGVNLRMSFSVYARKKFHTKGLGEILDQHRKGIHEQFSQILSTIEKNKTPELNAPTFAITTLEPVTPFPNFITTNNCQPYRGGQPKKKDLEVKNQASCRIRKVPSHPPSTIPLSRPAIIHMLKGVKVLKYILSHKEKLEKAASSVKLSEECSAVIKRSLPRKEEDLRSLTLPYGRRRITSDHLDGLSSLQTRAESTFTKEAKKPDFSKFWETTKEPAPRIITDIKEELTFPFELTKSSYKTNSKPEVSSLKGTMPLVSPVQLSRGKEDDRGQDEKMSSTQRTVNGLDGMLEILAGHEYYCFLDGFSGYFQILIAPEDQEKTTSFDHCLKNLEKMLKRCEETNLVLNWEKCHFMVKEGIVLGYKVSESGIEVDKAKIESISKLPYPTNVKAIRSFLGHAGFYRRFIKDFSEVARLMTQIL
ncbi:hypothetical protein Tco_0551193 [Tanacetum coccineum]